MEPKNKSFLSPKSFSFNLQRMPHVQYFLSKVNIPDLTLGQVDSVTNSFIKIPVPGDKLEFGSLDIEFKIDEDMKNYLEIYNWMISLGSPDNFAQRASINQKNNAGGNKTERSDATMILTDNVGNPNIKIKFLDMYPVSLSSLEYDVTENDINYLVGTASFVYRKFEFDN